MDDPELILLRDRLASVERRFHAVMAELMRLDRLAPLRSTGRCTELLPTPLGYCPCGNDSYELYRDEPLCIFHIYDAREAHGESVYEQRTNG